MTDWVIVARDNAAHAIDRVITAAAQPSTPAAAARAHTDTTGHSTTATYGRLAGYGARDTGSATCRDCDWKHPR